MKIFYSNLTFFLNLRVVSKRFKVFMYIYIFIYLYICLYTRELTCISGHTYRYILFKSYFLPQFESCFEEIQGIYVCIYIYIYIYMFISIYTRKLTCISGHTYRYILLNLTFFFNLRVVSKIQGIYVYTYIYIYIYIYIYMCVHMNIYCVLSYIFFSWHVFKYIS
jgi:hypothetical protein